MSQSVVSRGRAAEERSEETNAFVRIFTLVMRAQTSNYRFTVLDDHVDECGNVAANKTG